LIEEIDDDYDKWMKSNKLHMLKYRNIGKVHENSEKKQGTNDNNAGIMLHDATNM
jgi:hypothetical protein